MTTRVRRAAGRITDTTHSVTDSLAARLSLFMAMLGAFTNLWGDVFDAAAGDAAAQHRVKGASQMVQSMLTVVTLGLVIIVGILIYGEVDSALPQPDQTELQDAQTNATDSFASAMELAPVVLIVIIASLVLAVVSRFR